MQKESVLIIDDEEFILQLSRDILSKTEYRVQTAADGKTGMKLLSEDSFDLILTDIKMPDMNGLDVIRQVRTHNTEIPIIVITGHGTLDTAINALRLGAQGFILKPFTPLELQAAVAEALEKARLLRENIRMRALMPLFEVSKEIIGEVDQKRLLKLIVDTVVKETHAERVWLALFDENTGRLHLKEHYGLSPDFVHHAESVFKENNPLLITNEIGLNREIHEINKGYGMSSYISVPLSIRGNIIGLLCISRLDPGHTFSSSEIELVSVLSGQAAAAIENANLYEKLQQSYLSMIVTLSGVVEARDLYTDKHMKDISEYSVEIARKMGLPENDIENIRKAALLHDLGKICVPDHILMKAGKLSEEEMNIIKKHPVDGAKIIEPVAPIKEAREIIRHHHESFDGSGYPDGLRGEAIPLGARIIAVADAFGAMTTDRPYRNALSVADAIQEIRKFSEIQFDPRVVEIFIAFLHEKGIVQDTGRVKA